MIFPYVRKKINPLLYMEEVLNRGEVTNYYKNRESPK